MDAANWFCNKSWSKKLDECDANGVGVELEAAAAAAFIDAKLKLTGLLGFTDGGCCLLNWFSNEFVLLLDEGECGWMNEFDFNVLPVMAGLNKLE